MKGLSRILQGLVGLQWEDLNSETLLGLTLCPWKKKNVILHGEQMGHRLISLGPLGTQILFLKKRKKIPRQHHLL